MEITVYRNSKKVIEKEINFELTRAEKKQLLMMSLLVLSPSIFKMFFRLVALYPPLIKSLPTFTLMSHENALEFIGYIEYLLSNGLMK